MARIMILADLHFHNFPEFAKVTVHEPTGLPINSRLNDVLMTLVDCVKRAHTMGCRHMIVAGDVYDRRASVPTDVQQFAYWFFVWVVREMGWTVDASTGNHDQFDRAGRIHSLYNLQHIINVIDEPLEKVVGGANVAFIPYLESVQDTLHCFSFAGCNDPVDLVIAHTGVEGAAIGATEYRIKSPITLADIGSSRFKWVVLGHYHKPQKLSSNVLYVGSPAQINRAEMGDKKRFLVYDTSTHKIHSCPTGAKEFRTVTDVEFANLKDTDSAYFDVVLTGGADISKLTKGKSVKIVHAQKAKVSDKRIELSETMTDEQLLKAYLEHHQANPKFLGLGLNILSRVDYISSPYTNIKFKSMIVHNFMGISHAKINLNRPGDVVALLGEREDNPAFDSNGVGKSTILPEAPSWCLFGKTLRKMPADKVVNRFAKRDCYVKIALELDNSSLIVTRFRKHKKLGGTGLHLKLDGRDITEGTPDLTERKLAKLLGIDQVTFNSVVAFSPDNLRFVGATDANQKQVLDSILQTRRFTAALEVAKSIQSELKQNKLRAEFELQSTNALLLSAEETQMEYTESSLSFQARQDERLKRLNLELDAARQQHDTVSATKQEATHKFNSQTEKTQELLNNAPSLDVAQEVLTTTLGQKREQQQWIEYLETERAEVQSKLDSANKLADKPCPTCGSTVNSGKLIAHFQRARVELDKKIKKAKDTLVLIEEGIDEARENRDNAQEHRDLVEQSRAEENDIRQIILNYVSRLTRIEDTLKRLRDEIAEPVVNEYEGLLAKIAEKIAAHKAKQDSLTADIGRYTRQMDAMEFWSKAFGNSGIRSFLLDQILPDLTQYANEFSDILTGGTTLIEFSSYNEDTMKDGFKIQAWNQEGSDVYSGNSSGEKRRVDICVMFALFRIANKRTKINILLLDEVFDTLDTSGRELIVDAIQKLAQELHLSIYVTSHTSLSSLIYESIVLEKKDGQTTVKA